MGNSQENNVEKIELSKYLDDNIKIIKKIFINDDTLVIRVFQNKYLRDGRCCIFYIDGMVKTEIINENIIQPFLSNDLSKHLYNENLLTEIQGKILLSNDIVGLVDINEIVDSIISGNTAFILDGYSKALIINSKGWSKRTIEEPKAEMIVRGPREGFIESIIDNTTLIRRKLQTKDLKFVFKKLGVRSNTKICICYLEGLADPKIINEVYKRLDKISIDAVLDSGYIQEIIKDSPYSPFETIGYTERPDVVAGKLLEGRIAIIVDGSPIVLTIPFLFIEYFQTDEDYYNNYFFSSIFRMLRTIGMILSISIPAIYVALVTYHQELIPTPLLMSIFASRKGVPFPTIIEAITMLAVFELFVETSKRMPESMGMAVSLVGALVLGQAAVEARIVSSPLVIVVGLTGIASLALPKMKSPSVIIRFILLILVFLLGLYGYMFGIIGLLLHLYGIRSFGIPYMSNLGSTRFQERKDTTIRAPWWSMKTRPKMIAENNIRMKGIKPQVKDNENI